MNKTYFQPLLVHHFRFSSKKKIRDEHLTQSHEFCGLQVGLRKSSYLKFGVVFQPRFPYPSPAPTVFWGSAEPSLSSSSPQKSIWKGLPAAQPRWAAHGDSPKGHDGSKAEATSVHLFHKPYWGALAL